VSPAHGVVTRDGPAGHTRWTDSGPIPDRPGPHHTDAAWKATGEVTPVFWTGRDAKIVVKRPSQKPGDTHGPEAEDTCGGVQSAGGGGGDQRGADTE
ncbi:MAG: hypothetical protein JSS82_13985, partial [Bacteroidetes bacterium]|nr:hypothetical protein [Bacteroidota bacterium]